MNRATDWYKRRSQVMTLLVATALVVVSNADSLMIMDRLWANPVERAQIDAAIKNQKDSKDVDKVAKQATMALLGWSKRTEEIADPKAKDKEKTKDTEKTDDVKTKPYDRRTIPISWDDWMAKIPGLLLTIFAVSLGAPFWFDKLSMIMNIRSGGKPADAPATPGLLLPNTPGGQSMASSSTGSGGPPPNRVPSSDAGGTQ